jgi:CheY-like chemotaxis protein
MMNKKRIFIVEDEGVNAMLLKYALQKDHIILGIAVTGLDAIQQIIDQKPDLVIVDIRLEGEMTGIDVMNEIKKTHHVEHIYCTAYSDEEIIRDARKTLPIEVIIKPVNIISLNNMINR